MNFTEDQIDALTEVVNIGVGRAASSLHTMLDRHIELHVPQVRVCSVSEMRESLVANNQPLDTSVVQDFDGAIAGRAMLAFPNASGVTLAKLLSDEDLDDDELEYDLAGILEELGNIVLNGVLGSIANVFSDDFHYSVPEIFNGAAADALACEEKNGIACEGEQTCLLADARFDVADSKISGSLLLAFNTDELGVLLDNLLKSVSAA